MTSTPDRFAVVAWLKNRSPKARVILVPRRVDEPCVVTAEFLLDALDTGGEYHHPLCRCGKPWPCEDRT